MFPKDGIDGDPAVDTLDDLGQQRRDGEHAEKGAVLVLGLEQAVGGH